MISVDGYHQSDHIPIGNNMDDERQESSESDDSSERASHGIKRGGNNHFGSTGILKCLTCRKRKGRCEYNDINEACRFCADRSLKCGTKLSAKGARAYELSQQLLSLQREAGMVPFPDVSKLSSIASELERRYPEASVGEIYAMARPTVENAMTVATGQSRNDASVLFTNPVLGDTTPPSVQNPIHSARHTPVQHEDLFRTSVSHPPQQRQQHQQQPMTSPRREPEATTSYNIDSWFSTFPPPGPLEHPSSDFNQFQNDVTNFSQTQEFYPGLQPRPQIRHHHPQVHTDEGEMDYSSLFQQQQL